MMLKFLFRLPSRRNHFSGLTRRTISSALSVIDNVQFRKHLDSLLQQKNELDQQLLTGEISSQLREKILQLSPPVDLIKQLRKLEDDLTELNQMVEKESDESMVNLLAEERKELESSRHEICDNLVDLLMPDYSGGVNEVILEVQAGVGGVEAGIFAYDLFQLYSNFSRYKGWEFSPLTASQMKDINQSSTTVNKIQAEIRGLDVYKYLMFESGVHRVQRIPDTERHGRMHTSTAVVILLPKPTEIQIDINPNDIKIDVYKSRGGGGQSVNTTESAVRVTHLPTGVVAECQQERSQLRNKAIAISWLKSKLFEAQLEEQQRKQTNLKKLQIGGANRNEKIRTYNYPQGRVTDHRVKLTSNDLQQLMLGTEYFWNFLEDLHRIDRQERVLDFVENLNNQLEQNLVSNK